VLFEIPFSTKSSTTFSKKCSSVIDLAGDNLALLISVSKSDTFDESFVLGATEVLYKNTSTIVITKANVRTQTLYLLQEFSISFELSLDVRSLSSEIESVEIKKVLESNMKIKNVLESNMEIKNVLESNMEIKKESNMESKNSSFSSIRLNNRENIENATLHRKIEKSIEHDRVIIPKAYTPQHSLNIKNNTEIINSNQKTESMSFHNISSGTASILKEDVLKILKMRWNVDYRRHTNFSCTL
jgi:hypothetical protein